MVSPPITFLSDFGTTDTFVGVVKGVILGINPEAKIVDLSHDIPSFDIQSAAYALQQASSYFPDGTVHLAVVDPGVGGERKPIVVQAQKGIYVGPDNGIFSYIYEADPKARVFVISARKYRLKDTSPTFEGRDVFAPAAAWISKGISPVKMGKKVARPVRFDIPKPVEGEKGKITGQVIYVDRFGNLITNITRADLKSALLGEDQVVIRIGGREIKGLKPYYSGAAPGELAALINSDDHLEIFVFEGSAGTMTGSHKSDIVKVWCPQ